MRLAQKTVGTVAYEKLGAKQIRFKHPYCSIHEFDTDAFWECVIRHDSKTVFHPAGTCKMGALDDPTAVVDPQLRYFNIFK